MTITRAQMNRQLYQMGGMGMESLSPMQPAMQPAMQSAMYTPLENTYYSGMPTMANGGRIGYEEGGMGMEMMQPQMQEQAMMQPQMQQTPQIDPSQMDPKQALEIIIQMLIAQGIPPEQAREIAIQMVQAVAEGGMGEMSDERVEARFGGRIGYASGGIESLVNREQYGFGSFFKGVGKAVSGAVKGVTNAVKSVVKSDIGKLALTAAAIYATGGGAAFGGPGFSFMGTPALGDALVSGSPGLFGNLGLSAGYGSALGTGTGIMGAIGSGLGNIASGFSGMGVGDLVSKYGTTALISGAAGALGGMLAGGPPQQEPGESNEDYQRRVDAYKLQFQTAINNPNPQFGGGLYPNNPFYPQRRADGGRIGYGFGSFVSNTMVAQPVSSGAVAIPRPGQYDSSGGFGMNLIGKLIQQNPGMFNPVQSSNGITDLIKQTTKQTYFGNVTPMYNYNLQDLSNLREENDNYTYAANGGRMGYAMGAEVPTRQNQAGVKELDYRDTGGFVPPIGIKERADDIPAMLSNNEFVFTADAVRNAGNGSVNKGAERMYGLMKQLEAGGMV